MKKERKIILYLILIILNILVIYLSPDFVYSEGTDINSFFFAINDVFDFSYEPIFSLILVPFQYLASFEATSWIPIALVSISISIIIIRSKTNNLHIKLFWVFCLILPMSLINLRVGSAFLLIFFIPFSIHYWGVFVHWTYVFLFFEKIEINIKYIILLLVLLVIYLYFFANNINNFINKVKFYSKGEFVSSYGQFVFFETILLSLLYSKIYNKKNKAVYIQIVIIIISLLTQFFSLFVVAARLNLLSIGVSLISLRNKGIKKISILDIAIIYGVSTYEMLRFIVSIPNTNLWSLIH